MDVSAALHRVGRPLLVGHRGAPALAPENTMESFRAALNAGLDGVEIDVHRTSDGTLVVHHDPVTASGMPIDRSRWHELRRAHPGLPRLDEIFGEMEAWPGRWLNIELKTAPSGDDGRTPLLADALASWPHEAASRAWISCFDADSLVALHDAGVERPLALLVWNEAGLDALEGVPEGVVAGLHVEQALASTERVARWHDRGLFVFAWTVNEERVARGLIEAGVDGLIGDRPDVLQRSLG